MYGYPMSVTVVLIRNHTHQETASSDIYKDAQNIAVTPEGVLTVGCGWHGDRVIVGAYPAGTWVNAYVDQDREWQATP
jgi:hypothetical protein